MRTRWHLLTDDPDERERFASLDRVLGLPREPAAPPNRLRFVHRIGGDGAIPTSFLKIFERTQPKNRLTFARTHPRATCDAERELRVTLALRAAGVETPRPLAWGRRGRTSFYLCAELPGRPLSDLDGAERASALPTAATFCGRLLAQGFWLPDLSPDHLWLRPSDAGWRAAVLDLHNGRLGRAGPPPPRIVRRVLRRFHRAARRAGVRQRTGLGFAVRLLRAAGHGNEARRILAPLPPLDTSARYDAGGKSHAYADRNAERAAREQILLRKVWPGRRGESVLDLPSGAGRLEPWLRDELGHTAIQCDASEQMLRRAREAGHASEWMVLGDALAPPFADGAVDGVVAFRFLHHLPANDADRVIAESCRVASRFVVVSFFHPCSAHGFRRALNRLLTGGAKTRFERTLGAIARSFARHGYRLTAHAADLPFARDLWVAAFTRAGSPPNR